MTNPSRTQGTVDAVNEWFTERFSRLTELSAQFLARIELNANGQIEVAASTQRQLRQIAEQYLEDNLAVDGCGLIFSRSAMGTENGHLEWWVREDEQRFARYSFGVVPGGDRYYDYEHHEWFIRAFHEDVPVFVGPYLDYLGVEAYVTTLTVPATLDGTRIGVIGNDIQLADLEKSMLPLLLGCPADAILIGTHNNVLISNSASYLPGEQVPSDLTGFRRIAVEPPSIGLELLIAE